MVWKIKRKKDTWSLCWVTPVVYIIKRWSWLILLEILSDLSLMNCWVGSTNWDWALINHNHVYSIITWIPGCCYRRLWCILWKSESVIHTQICKRENKQQKQWNIFVSSKVFRCEKYSDLKCGTGLDWARHVIAMAAPLVSDIVDDSSRESNFGLVPPTGSIATSVIVHGTGILWMLELPRQISIGFSNWF